MKLTNKDRQQQLDEVKWNISQIENKDMSGKMEYCKACIYNKEDMCIAEQYERATKTLCAKAFNKSHSK